MTESTHETKPTSQTDPGKTRILLSTRVPASVDWGEAISSDICYGREQELAMLERWIVVERARLIAVLGLGGIGKTALVGTLAQRIQGHFEFVFWRSLRNAPLLEDIVSDFLKTFCDQRPHLPDESEHTLSLFMSSIRSARCLIILDNVETILQSGNTGRVGRYLAGYEDYGSLLARIGASTHNSCIILTSREKPDGLSRLEGKHSLTHSFHLSGLADDESYLLLQGQELIGSKPACVLLSQQYAGNPLALRLVSSVITQVFGSNIPVFLRRNERVFSDIRDLLDEQFERLSSREKAVLYWLALERTPVSLRELEADIMAVAPAENVLEVLDFLLRRRSWIERNETGQKFTLQPVIMEYITTVLLEQLYQELQTGPFHLFTQHALLKAHARDSLRSIQTRLILRPLLERLLTAGAEKAKSQLLAALTILRHKQDGSQGYAPGNILNLLALLTPDLRGHDFSHLTLWQAFLSNVDLRGADCSFSDMSTSIFTEAFGSVLSLTFTLDETLLAAGTARGEIWVWQVANGKLLFSRKAHHAWVNAVAFSADGTHLASGGGDHLVKVWDLQHGHQLKAFEGHTREVSSVVFRGDGKFLASGGYDRTIILWSLQQEQAPIVLQGRSREITALAFSPDGTLLADGGNDGSLQVWDVEQKTCLRTFQEHAGTISAVAFSSDGKKVIGVDTRAARMWQMSTGERLQALEVATPSLSLPCIASTTSLIGWSDAEAISIYDLERCQCIQSLTENVRKSQQIVCSPRGKLLAATDEDQQLKIWNVASGQCIRTVQGYTNPLWSLAFHPDGDRFAGGGDDRSIRIWNTSDGQCLRTFQGHTGPITAVAFSPDGNRLASGSWDRSVRLWDVQGGRCLRTFKAESTVWSLAFSADGTHLLCGCHDQSANVWDVHTGHRLFLLPGQKAWAGAISVICSSQRMLLAVSDKDGTVRVWDIGQGKELYALQGHTAAIWSLAFSPDGSLLAGGDSDHQVILWDMASGQRTLQLQAQDGWISTLAFRFDGKVLVAGSSDQYVNLWYTRTGQLLAKHQAHTNRVTAVTVSPVGNMLISSDFDEHIIQWNLRTGTVYRTLQIDRPYEGMDITGITGVTDAQKASLKTLGAVEKIPSKAPLTVEQDIQQKIRLTQREQTILQLIADGYSNSEISQTLYISRATVKTHINNLFTKLAVQDRLQAASLARRLNLLP